MQILDLAITQPIFTQIVGTLLFGGSTLLFIYLFPTKVIIDVVDVLLPSPVEGKDLVEEEVPSFLPEQKSEQSVLQEKDSAAEILLDKGADLLEKCTEQLASELVQYHANLSFPSYLKSLERCYDLLSEAIQRFQFNDCDFLFYSFASHLTNFLKILSPLLISFFSGEYPFTEISWSLLGNVEILKCIESLNIHFNDWWHIVESFLRGVYLHAKFILPHEYLSMNIERFWEGLKFCYKPDFWDQETLESYIKTHLQVYDKFYPNSSLELKRLFDNNWSRISSLDQLKNKGFIITCLFSIMLNEKGAFVCSELGKLISLIVKIKP